MQLVELTHANAAGSPTIYVVPSQIFSWYVSSTAKCTHVVSTGGAMLPVSETPDQILQKLAHVGLGVGKEPMQQKGQDGPKE